LQLSGITLAGNSTSQVRLASLIFYGVILSGLLLGGICFSLGGWLYIESSEQKPSGLRIWEGYSEHFVIPICAMLGATFGGLFGVGIAVFWDHSFITKANK
jgi:hypothetical protein